MGKILLRVAVSPTSFDPDFSTAELFPQFLLAFIYVILNFLAYMLHQLIALSDRLFQAAVEKVGSEYKLWADIRVLVSYFVWATWEALLEHILDYKHKTSLESG